MLLFNEFFKEDYQKFIKHIGIKKVDINLYCRNIKCKDGLNFTLLINNKSTFVNEINYKSILFFDIIVDSLLISDLLDSFFKGELSGSYGEDSQFYYEDIPISIIENFIIQHQGIVCVKNNFNKVDIDEEKKDINIETCEEILSIAKVMINDENSLKYFELLSKELNIDFERL